MDDSSQSDDDFELTPDISEVELKSEPLDDDLAGDDALDKDGSRPVRPVERQKMRPWLVELLDSNNVPGLSWQNRKDRIFRISWKHAAHNCFNRTRDSDLFERWAYHTGRHYEGNHKRWKANFRCALNSLPDVIELRDLGVRKGDNAFKVYKFLEGTDPMYKDKMDPKKKHSTSSSQLKRAESKSEATSSGEGSSIPTSPEHETEEEGGMNALLKAIELHTQGDGGKRDKHGKRGSRADEGQSSPKRMKRDREMSNIPTIVHDDDIPVVKGQADRSSKKSSSSSSASESKSAATKTAPPSIPSSTQTSSSTPTPSVTESSQVAPQVLVGGAAGGQQVLSVLPKYPYLQTLEQKTGKITIVHLRKSDKDGGSIVQLSASEVCNMLNQDPKLMAVPVTMTTSEGGAAPVSSPSAVVSSGQGQSLIVLPSEDSSTVKSTNQAQQTTLTLTAQGQTSALQPVVNKSQESKQQLKDNVSTSTDPLVNNVPLTSVTVSLQGVEGKMSAQGTEEKIGTPVSLPVHLATMIQNPSATKAGQDQKSQPSTSVASGVNTSVNPPDLPSVTISISGDGQGQGRSKVQNIPAPVADMLAWMKSHADPGGELALKAAGHPLLISNAVSSCVATVASPSVSTSVSAPLTATATVTSSQAATLSAIQSNKSIVNRFSSIAEALSMASGSSVMPEIRAIRTQDLVNSTLKNPVSTTMAVSTPVNTSVNPVIPTDSQNVRSKLVTRLLVSGTSPGLTSMGTMVRHPVPGQPGLVACSPMVVNTPIPPRHIDPNLARGLTPNIRTPVTSSITPVPINVNDLRMATPGIVVTAMSANLLGRPFSTASSVALAGSAIMSDALKNGSLSQKPVKTSTQTEPELSPPALIRMDQMAVESTDTTTGSKESDPTLDSDMPQLEQQKDVSDIKPEYLKEHVTIELGNITEESGVGGPVGEVPPGSEPYYMYFCLWCQKHFSRKVDLLQHFMSLHQDMLIVPGTSEGSEATLDLKKIQELVSMAKVNSSGLTTTSGGVMTFQHNESQSDVRNEKGLYNAHGQPGASTLQGSFPQDNVLDLTTKKKETKPGEVLDLRKKGRGRGKPKGTAPSSKKSGGVGKTRKTATKNKNQSKASMNQSDNVIGQFDIPNSDGQKVIVQAIPTVVTTSENLIGQPKVFDNPESGNMSQPKYCLNSLIAALRDSIERDKKDPELPDYGEDESDDNSDGVEDDAGSATSYGEDSEEDSLHSDTENKTSDDLYRGLSPDSQSDEETESVLGVDKEIQVSLKTVVVDGKTMYKCSKCNKMFSKTCTFARHAMVHAKLYPYQCGICDEMKCSDMRVLLRHLDWHGENVECPCKKCERLYKEDLKTEADQTKDLACRFSCDICGKKFISDVVCKAHVNMHRRKTIECEICKMEFKCNRNLSKHRKLAHGVQFCPVCFEACRDIATHIHLHSGIFMYKCGLCGDAFNSRPLLHDHLKVHTHLGKNIGPKNSPQKDASRSKSKGSSSFGTQSSVSSEMKIQTLKMQKGSEKGLKVSKGKKGGVKSVSPQIDTGSNTSLREETDSPRPDTSRSPKGKARPDIESLISEDSIGAISESSASNISASGDGNSGSMSLRKRKSRRCRWHDNDSVCERCDETFIKTIAFGRKPKSKSGKDSPRIDDNESRSSVRTLNDFSDSSDGLEDPPTTSLPTGFAEPNFEEQLN